MLDYLLNSYYREYYHQKLAPSSDVDLFIWGLDEDAAFEEIKQIEFNVRNAILEEVTAILVPFCLPLHSLTNIEECTDQKCHHHCQSLSGPPRTDCSPSLQIRV